MTNTVTHTHTDDRSELLSGYRDRALDMAARQQAEQTLETCAACSAEYADLQSLHRLLRELPAPVPRRSFTIDPATVRPRRLLFPIFRFASLAAAMLLVVVLGIDVLSGSTGQTTSTTMLDNSAASNAAPPAAGGAAESAPYSAQAATEAPMTMQEAAPTEAAATAMEAAPADATADQATAAAESLDMPMDAMAATPEAALVPPEAGSTTVAGGDVGNVQDSLRSSDNAAAETEALSAPAPEHAAPPLDIWGILALVLAVFTVGLGGAWWWTARRGI